MSALLEKMKPSPLPFEVEKLISHLRLVPARVRQTWNDIVQISVRENRCEELHTAREEFIAYVDEQVAIMEWSTSGKILAGRYHAFARLTELEQALAELRDFRQNLFSRWKSLEDLEELIAEQTALPAETLTRLARLHPPPSEWFQQSDKPY